jgi:hypothetical protein
MPVIKWSLMHEATALSAYLKNVWGNTEQLKWLDLAYWHIESTYTRESPDAIISCNCHGFNIIEVKFLLDVKLVSIQLTILCCWYSVDIFCNLRDNLIFI